MCLRGVLGVRGSGTERERERGRARGRQREGEARNGRSDGSLQPIYGESWHPDAPPLLGYAAYSAAHGALTAVFQVYHTATACATAQCLFSFPSFSFFFFFPNIPFLFPNCILTPTWVFGFLLNLISAPFVDCSLIKSISKSMV